MAQEPAAQPGSSAVGTDLNRNWGYRWGCCGGSSGNPPSSTYRGASAFSAPETRAVRDFVNSRVVGGVQQLRAAIDFHTYWELVLWPYGYTYSNTATGMNADQYNTFATMGRAMAATNGYTPEQASDLYIADGILPDWAWGATASSPSPSRCTRGPARPASTRPTKSSPARPPATAPPCCTCSAWPTAPTGRSASRPATAPSMTA